MRVVFFRIGHGPCLVLQRVELKGDHDVGRDRYEEHDTRAPEQFDVGLQKSGIGVEPIRTQEDLKVSEQVADDEAEKHDAGDGHNGLFHNGGRKKAL